MPGLRGAPAVGVLHEGQETQPAAVAVKFLVGKIVFFDQLSGFES